MFNPKTELVKKASEIAHEKYPDGFNKSQLIECSNEIYGGFGITQTNPLAHKKIETMQDVSDMGNAMAQIDGRYPVGMSGCEVVGINGGCGGECPVYLDGECGVPGEMFCDEMSVDEKKLHLELYGED